ncbi:hypothetical protein BJV82DRAFT_35097 [Fennellomyces sp. T-0311]|nr:hypothetical protein BJV82DRAFT_35097 [Fennellomyces sp. T-0311]
MPKATSAFPLGVILSTCSNLTHLHCSQERATPTPQIFGSLPTTPLLSLVNCELSFRHLESDLVERTLACCPSLRSLAIGQCSLAAAASVKRHCRNLHTLGFNTHLKHTSGRNEDVYGTDTPRGIRFLSIAVDADDEAEEIIQLISENAEVIETTSMHFSRPEPLMNTVHQWDPLSAITFSNLCRLVISGLDEVYSDIIPGMLAGCANLEALILEICQFIDAPVFDQISGLEHLNSLELRLLTDVDEGGILAMFHVFTTRPSLRTIRIDSCLFTMPFGVYQAIATIPMLENLHLTMPLFLNTVWFDRFATMLREHASTLYSIVIRDTEYATDTVLEQIASIESLRKVQLRGLRNVTSKGIGYLEANSNISLQIDKPLISL